MNRDRLTAFSRHFLRAFADWKIAHRISFVAFAICACLFICIVLVMCVTEFKQVTWGTKDRSRSSRFEAHRSCMEWWSFTPDAGVAYHNTDGAGWRVSDAPIAGERRWMPRAARIRFPDGESAFVKAPLWIPAAVFGSVVLLVLSPIVRTAIRRAKGLCFQCGYAISPGLCKCPECGTSVVHDSYTQQEVMIEKNAQ